MIKQRRLKNLPGPIRLTAIHSVSTLQLAIALAGKQILVIDVRTREEYDSFHIRGTISLPLAELAERMQEIPADKIVYILCQSGGRSLQAAKFLLSQGYKTIYYVRGGLKNCHYLFDRTQEICLG